MICLCLQNLTRLGHSDLDLPGRCLPGVGSLEHLRQLLERLALSLHEEEVDSDELDTDPNDVDEVQFPANLSDTDANTVGVDDHGDVEEEEVQAGTLGSGTVLQALNGVEGLERSPSPCEEDAEEVDGDDSTICHVRVGAGGCGEGSKEDVRAQSTDQTGHEHDTSAKLVEKSCTVDGSNQGEDGVDSVDKELGAAALNAGSLNHLGHEV